METKKEKEKEVSKTPQSCTYDDVNKTINLQNIRATELKSNKRVNIVECCDLHFETKCENLKVEMMKTVNTYKKENKSIKYSNLPEDEREGLESIMDRVDKNEIKIIETDKSKKFSVNTPSQYVEDMKTHIEGHKIVDRKFINKTIKMLNDTTKSLVKIVNIGECVGHLGRILKNVHVDCGSFQ